MVGRWIVIALAAGVLLGASTLQQLVDIQPDGITDVSNTAPSVDDLTPTVLSLELPAPDRQLVAVTWTTSAPQGRVHTDPVFRPPCADRVSQS